MEALLHTTVMYFERRISLLSWMLEIVLNELQAQTMWVTSSDRARQCLIASIWQFLAAASMTFQCS